MGVSSGVGEGIVVEVADGAAVAVGLGVICAVEDCVVGVQPQSDSKSKMGTS